MNGSTVAAGVPTWVWVLLVGLVVLGVRRLRTREVPLAVALLPSIAFLIWSLFGAYELSRAGGVPLAALAWIGGALLGVASTFLIAEPRGQRRPGGRILLPATALPLVLYLTVFVVRFICGAWAAMRPAQALTATAIGTAVGAAMTARLIVAITRWR